MQKLHLALTISALLVASIAASSQNSDSSAAASSSELHGINKAYIDKSVDPCQDFFQYACGKFSTLHPIPPDRPAFGNAAMMADENEKILNSILDKAAAGGPGRTPNEQKIGDYYAACLDTAAINREGLKPLQPEFDRIKALRNKSELPALLAHDQLININAFLGFGEQQDFNDATRQIATLDQGGLGLPEKDYYLRTGEADQKIRQQYVDHIADTFKLLGKPEAEAKEDAQKVMDLETALAKVSQDVTSRRNPHNIYHMMPVAEVEKLAPSIDWNKFLADIGTPPIKEINVTNPDFFKGLNSILDSTSLDTIKLYLEWQLINGVPSTALPQAFDDSRFDFYGKVLRGQPQQRPRWKRCVQSTDAALGEALGQVYVSKAFPPSSKAATLQMVHDIEGAMARLLQPRSRARRRPRQLAPRHRIRKPPPAG